MHLSVTTDGWLHLGQQHFRCALGRGGVREDKSEGDGATPVGRYPLRRLLYRADRLDRPDCRLPMDPINPDDGWCDAPRDDAYNRPVRLPYPASAERMWRDDRLYDVVVVIGHNDAPVTPGQGSAIFLHVASPGYGPTEGCVALAPHHLLAILPALDQNSEIEITSPSAL